MVSRRLHADLPPHGYRHRQARIDGDLRRPPPYAGRGRAGRGLLRCPVCRGRRGLRGRYSGPGESSPSWREAPGCTSTLCSPAAPSPLLRPSGHRARLQAIAAAEGLSPLRAELEKIDPEAAARLHPNDEKRIIRALEVWYETGKTITAHNLETQALPPRYDALKLGLNFADRADLWARIDARVDEMMDAGLEAEVRALLAEGIPERCTAMQAIGVQGDGRRPAGRAGAPPRPPEKSSSAPRQYAKRQLTWFRRDKAVRWMNWDKIPNFANALQNSTAYMEDFGLL